MTKICHLTSAHPPSDVRIFHKEIKTLLEAGYEITLIAQHDQNEIADGIPIRALAKQNNRFLRIAFLPGKTYSLALKEKADLYHLHDPELIPVGVLLKLFTGAKVVYDAHEDYGKQALYKEYLPITLRRSVSLSLKAIEHMSSRLFDAVITATDDILSNFTHHRRAISLKNFPILSKYSHVAYERAKKNQSFTLVYIGGLSEIRGTTETIQALEAISPQKEIKLKLVGKFDPPGYEDKIKNLAGYKRVEYLGWLRPERIPALLRDSDAGIVCLHPIDNYLTSLPVKLFEYMASGLPVIASNFPFWQKIVEGNKCGLCVNPLNPSEIARAIVHLMENPDKRTEMGENGRKAVLGEYNWERESIKLLRLYRSLLK